MMQLSMCILEDFTLQKKNNDTTLIKQAVVHSSNSKARHQVLMSKLNRSAGQHECKMLVIITMSD